MSGGAIVGPSLGHFYARQTTYAVITTAARTAVGLGFGALAVASCPEFEGCTSDEETRSLIFFSLSVGLVGASAIYDIIRAPTSARAYNRRNAARLSFFPQLSLDGSVAAAARLSF